jgi:beta-N-acetylhexosaminidase
MRSRLLPAVLALVTLLAGCTGTADRDEGRDEGGAAAPSTGASAEPEPPGPAERLGIDGDWGPSPAQLDRAARLVRGMAVPALAGQVIVADHAGTVPVGMVRDLRLGGVIAFGVEDADPDWLRAQHARLQRTARRRWPVLVGVDQEGGIVERLHTGVTRFPTFMSAGAAHDPGLTRQAYAAGARELRGLGFTVDFAPVADVTIGPADPAIGSRSASSDPRVVGEQAVAAARGFMDSGVVPVVKHFPGHGSVTDDSHVTLPVQDRPLGQLRRRDLVPFRRAVAAGLPAVMVGHLDVRAVAPGVPSSLAGPVVTGLLRRELGFDGAVVTDSLEMAAVTRRFGSAASAVRALRAGSDVLLMPPDPRAARDGIVRAVRRGALSVDRLRRAAARSIALALLGGRPGPRGTPGTARAASRRLSAAATTVVSGPCRGRLVGDAVLPSGDPAAVGRFAVAARAAGLEVLARRSPPGDLVAGEPRPRRRAGERRRAFRQRVERWQRGEARREAALADWQAREESRLAAATGIAFTGWGDGPASAEVVVATDRPHVLAGSSGDVEVATYGDTPGAMAALVAVLLGRERAPGRLPVPVAGVERRGC